MTRARAYVDGIGCPELYFIRQALDTKYYAVVVESIALGSVAAGKHVDIIAHVLRGLSAGTADAHAAGLPDPQELPLD